MQGFEEIHVPALKPKPFAKNERIVKIKELPAWMHPAFEGMDALNRIQSRVRQQCFTASGPHSVLLCHYALDERLAIEEPPPPRRPAGPNGGDGHV